MPRTILIAILALYAAVTAHAAGEEPHGPTLAERIQTIVQGDVELKDADTVGRLLGLDESVLPSRWTRMPDKDSYAPGYTINTLNPNGASGIRAAEFKYWKGFGSLTAVEEIRLKLFDTPCITVPSLQAGLKAEPIYGSLPGRPEPWNPNPRPVTTGEVVVLNVKNKSGRKVTLDAFNLSTANCVVGLRMWMSDTAAFIDAPPS
jgi:hypothetical protein